MNRAIWMALALPSLLALGACDGRYAHAACMQSADEPSCSTCCASKGFSTEVIYEPNDEIADADCWCVRASE